MGKTQLTYPKIPAPLRHRVGLTESVAFVGLDGDRFQLWLPSDLDRSFEYVTQNSAEILDHLAELGV